MQVADRLIRKAHDYEVLAASHSERGALTADEVHVLACTECARVSSATARGWRAYRSDDPEAEELPKLAFYCPECARREFQP